MRIRNTIIVLVLLAIVGGYAIVVGLYSKPDTEVLKLLKIQQTEIAKITLRYPDREIVIERAKGGPWKLTLPIGTEADQTASNNLARAIADCSIVRIVDDKPADLAPFGLNNPATIVTVTTFDGKPHPSIAVGKTTPVGFNTYIKTSDKPAVMLTEAAFQSGMVKSANDLRDRDLVTFVMDDVKRLTLTRDNGETVEAERVGDNWKIVKPTPYAADATQIRQVLSALINAKAADFVVDAPASVSQYGLEKPHLTATAYLKDGSQQSLLFGFKQKEQGKDGVYVRRGERAPVYTVHQYIVGSADRSLLDLRDKTVFSFDPAAVGSIKIKNPSGEFSINRATDRGWTLVTGGKSSNADVAVVERLLAQIRDLKATSIVADPVANTSMFGLDNPALAIDLAGKDGKPIGTIRLARVAIKVAAPAAPGENPAPSVEYYASSSTSKAVYSVADFYLAQLNKPPQMYLARQSAVPATGSTPAK
jgi:hypothetical protein